MNTFWWKICKEFRLFGLERTRTHAAFVEKLIEYKTSEVSGGNVGVAEGFCPRPTQRVDIKGKRSTLREYTTHPSH